MTGRRLSRSGLSLAGPLLAGLLALPALAAPELPLMTSTPAADGGQSYSLAVETLLFLTALAFLPAVLLMMTSFVRIVIVLALMRQALGTMQAPPNQVLIGLALFLTLFIMSPVFQKVYEDAWQPFSAGDIGINEALDRASVPMKDFMLRQTREPDLALFINISGEPPPATEADISMKTLIPAYVISELKTAFQIGFLIFLPFVIIDMVVASVLMSMGMMMLSPVMISLPFKLMLFVLVDGWSLIILSLVRSFQQ